jgi:hypothetical protein
VSPQCGSSVYKPPQMTDDNIDKHLIYLKPHGFETMSSTKSKKKKIKIWLWGSRVELIVGITHSLVVERS